MRARKCLFVLLLTLLTLLFNTEVFGKEIQITGSAEFQNQIHRALNLLRNKAPDKYDTVLRYIGRIKESEKSAMWAYDDPPTFELAYQTAFYSITWCASSIAHDSFHSKLYHEYRDSKGPIPAVAWTGKAAEKKCLKYQVATLKKIGAPKSEIDYCRKNKPTYSDRNNDGTYNWDDYKQISW
ncbi:MAG TPA: hypothetical protein VHO84_13185 [Syntrophorhabdaceae bacterium]|nr:hypothetical protein [Syntrophorhabdaceae bacterium]